MTLKVVCGANPAYDAFPAQHQLFYPTYDRNGKATSALWYDPCFKVETVDRRKVWTKRHYRCTPRRRQMVDESRQERLDGASATGAVPGLWTLTTLDNGVVSNEHVRQGAS